MKKTLSTLIAASLTMGVFVALPSRTFAQDTQTLQNKTIPSLELEQADVRDALKILFKDVGVSYTVAPDVQGSITVNLHNVPFETALQGVLKQVDATYRVEAGVFNIIKKEEVAPQTEQQGNEPPVTTNKTRIQRIKILHTDPMLIMALLEGKVGATFPPEISTMVGGGG